LMDTLNGSKGRNRTLRETLDRFGNNGFRRRATNVVANTRPDSPGKKRNGRDRHRKKASSYWTKKLTYDFVGGQGWKDWSGAEKVLGAVSKSVGKIRR